MMGTDLALSRAVTGTWPRPGDQGPSLDQTELHCEDTESASDSRTRDGPHGPASSPSHLETGDPHYTLQCCTDLGRFDPNMI